MEIGMLVSPIAAYIVLPTTGFLVLYDVVKAAVRNGIREARAGQD